jgi:FAD/FMN-containing dehydrogenase
MMQGPGSAVSLLTALVGADVISNEPQQIARFASDHRGLYRGQALAVARPRKLAEISKILGFCNQHRLAVVPAAGNTSYCGGATPDASGTQLVVSLERMNTVRRVLPLDYCIEVEAGCILQNVQTAATAAERFFPLAIGAQGSCQIGGNLATNAGGLNVLRYGMMRDLVLGLEVVLADGRVLSHLSTLRKDNTGYDLKSLFLGSEGTLGIISAATLKLFPLPRVRATALAQVANPAAAVELLALMREASGDRVSSFELIPGVALDLVSKYMSDISAPFAVPAPWQVLVEWSSSQPREPLETALTAALQAAAERGLLQDAALAQNETQRAAFWRLRENIPTAQQRAGASLKHDISVPISQLAAFIERGAALAAQLAPEGFLVAYGHVGDGNLHFNVSQKAAADRSEFLTRAPALQRALHDCVAELGGSFSAEHGIGQLKVEELARYSAPHELELMRAVKQLLDPNGIMNPGKVLKPRG